MKGFAGKPAAITGLSGFAAYTLGLGVAASLLPAYTFDPQSRHFIAALGVIALWRYSWGLLHYIRSIIYRARVFPRMRAQAEAGGDALLPPHVYILLTSFRIDAKTTVASCSSAIREAVQCGLPATVVASVVELGDELLVKNLFRLASPPERVRLMIVRIPGTGKRDGLAQGFRAISRDLPPPGAVVAVMDGDCMLERGTILKCAPFFALDPNVGALTTDEDCAVEGSATMTAWHRLRFAQRHLQMSSVGLSRKVTTLTGRMSMFRAEIITDPSFIAQVEHDAIDHWRLGRFKFLTGDDKSTWYWVLKNGYDMLYIPDVVVKTVEHPPSPSFFKASTILMRRWFGNMLRTNGRAFTLGPARSGLFMWWCVLDQRVAMWTSLLGPAFALLLAFTHSWLFLPVYMVWVGFTRWVMALMLLSARPAVSWRYPFLIYYNQIWGACVKTYTLFRPDRQSWTRQKTKLERDLNWGQQVVLSGSSALFHGVAILSFIALIGALAGIFTL